MELPRAPEPSRRAAPEARLALSTSGIDAALLRSRLLVYAWVLGGIKVAIILAVVAAEYLYRMPTPWLSRPAGHLHLALTVVLGVAILLLRRAPLSAVALAAIDVAITVMVALQSAHSILAEVPRVAVAKPVFWSPDHAQELKSLLMLAHLLLLRAAVLPSKASRTAALGALAAAPIAVATAIAYARTPIMPQYATVPLFTALVWIACSVAVSTVCSSAIYGLRRQVHDAMRLGQYTLEQKVGQGGMGVVYRARHALLKRPTAVKVLLTERVGQLALERFEREVQLTAKLSHPNIVSVYDFGRAQDGTFYYAMEFLDGIDLQELVDRRGPQPAGRVRSILQQACLALAEAHAVHLIHRDIKPANMVLTRRASEVDVLKLVDFGLVKHVDAATLQSHDRVRELRGTPLYMSPEAVLSPQLVGPSSDLYALGAVGYFLLTGSSVFEGKTTFAVLSKHAHEAPLPPSERGSAVPAKLEFVILRCLEKAPERRYADARALWAALVGCDDVQPWTQEDASAWWHEHDRVPRSPVSGSGVRNVLTVNLDARVAERRRG